MKRFHGIAFAFFLGAQAFAADTHVAEQVRYLTGKDSPILDLRTVESMGGLRAGAMPVTPWSDSYWPDGQGGIASPYADSSFPDMIIFPRVNMSSFRRSRESLWPRATSLTADEIDVLSPAEKYDLLVGDTEFTLARSVWEGIDYRHHHTPDLDESGRIRTDENGNIIYRPRGTPLTPTWAGICNGWAAAALSLPRPNHTVTLSSPFGQTITFYPADIRALASHLWARSSINTATVSAGGPPVIRHAGVRCNESPVRRDSGGRPKNEDCADVDPGVWHLSVLNKLGVDQVGLVIDKNFKGGVSNHPVYFYEYHYFNPETGKDGDFASSLVPFSEVRRDPYADYRSPDAVYMIGVEMQAKSLEWIKRTHEHIFTVANDKTTDEEYMYDLELDADMRVVGGEWRFLKKNRKPFNFGLRMASHPDFIWAPLPGWKAYSIGDFAAEDGAWRGTGALPTTWQMGIAQASRSSQPLAEIVDLLIELSRQ